MDISKLKDLEHVNLLEACTILNLTPLQQLQAIQRLKDDMREANELLAMMANEKDELKEERDLLMASNRKHVEANNVLEEHIKELEARVAQHEASGADAYTSSVDMLMNWQYNKAGSIDCGPAGSLQDWMLWAFQQIAAKEAAGELHD